jgi:hypothetical protein
MSRSCICDGQNPSCRHCGGSGMMPDRLAVAFDETIRRITIENSQTEDIKASPRPWWFPSNISVPPCPKGCGRWVDPQRVEEHLRNCTGPQKTKPIPASNPKPGEVGSAKDPTRQDTSFVAPRDKNLDATKLYAHPYREQGRYGSHPSHDGFDDESTPD